MDTLWNQRVADGLETGIPVDHPFVVQDNVADPPCCSEETQNEWNALVEDYLNYADIQAKHAYQNQFLSDVADWIDEQPPGPYTSQNGYEFNDGDD